MVKEVHYAGYATEPSDYECADGQLATSLNLISEDNQLKPVFQPALRYTLPSGYRVITIHNTAAFKHFIVLNTATNALFWFDALADDELPATVAADDMTFLYQFGTVYKVETIGNTVVALTNLGVQYFLWDADKTPQQYIYLGQKPPMLEITFGLHSDFAVYPDKKNTGSGFGSDYGGAKVSVAEKIKNDNGIMPQLGNSDSGEAWAMPRAVMAASTSSNQDKLRKFASDYATYSIENVAGENETDKASLLTIKNTLTNGVLAQVNTFVNEKGTKENKFVMPFFVRYAYRLYDGSYMMHSYPVLMIPNSRGPIFGADGTHGLYLRDLTDNYMGFRIYGRVYGFLGELVYSILSVPAELSKWKDIITSIDIGVSAPAFTYDQAGYVFGWTNMDDNAAWNEYYSISRVMKLAGTTASSTAWSGVKPLKQVFQALESATRKSDYGEYFNRYNATYNYPSYIATVPQKNISDINNVLTGATAFYIIKELSIDELQTCNEKTLELDEGTLGGLLGRKQIGDDYHTHDHLKSEFCHSYNARLNLAGVQRTPHAPINPAIQFTQGSDAASTSTTRWQVAITIKNNTQTLTVQSDVGYNYLEFPRWIYYPDANAKFAYVTTGGTTYRLKLTPHDHLNGAYWLADIMKQRVTPTTDIVSTLPTISTDGSFDEKNKIYTSEVNNPFYFPLLGINTVGTGTILGISSAVKALSQGQFGQFPLYAFTTDGVWALEVSATGTYSAKQPVTRDVCTGPDSITQIDDAVLFATNRGIMLLQGSQTTCITDIIFSEAPFNVLDLPCLDQLHAKLGHTADACLPVRPFLSFLDGCQMVYDYVHQHIIVFNPATDNTGSPLYTYAYVYSLKSKQWGMMFSNLLAGINAYPDAMAMLRDNKLVSFSNTDETVCHGLYVTRPLKLEAADVHKTVSALIQRGHFERGDVGTVLYGSRDLYNWRLIWSSRDHYLRGFRGTAYKYFRIAGLVSLTDGKSVFGASVQFDPRHTNNLR